jgi:hypothetical protein
MKLLADNQRVDDPTQAVVTLAAPFSRMYP